MSKSSDVQKMLDEVILGLQRLTITDSPDQVKMTARKAEPLAVPKRVARIQAGKNLQKSRQPHNMPAEKPESCVSKGQSSCSEVSVKVPQMQSLQKPETKQPSQKPLPVQHKDEVSVKVPQMQSLQKPETKQPSQKPLPVQHKDEKAERDVSVGQASCSGAKEMRPEGQSKVEQMAECLKIVDAQIRRIFRKPTQREILLLSQVCHECKLPVLSRKEFQVALGKKPTVLGKGAFGEALLNSKLNLVTKCSHDIDSFRNAIFEAKFLQLLNEQQGIQRLVGLCPDELALVTQYGGPTFDKLYNLSLEQKISIGIQIAEACAGFHAAGFAHNDIKENNICVEITPAGPVVTIIDFGMADLCGTTVTVACEWHETLHYAPEICKSDTAGQCSSMSDVFSIGQIICLLFEGLKMPLALRYWFFKSQSKLLEVRPSLQKLIEYLEAERRKNVGAQEGG